MWLITDKMTQLCSLEHHDHAVRLLHQRMTCVNTLFQTDGLTKRPIQTCLRCLLLSSGNRWIPTGFVVMRECSQMLEHFRQSLSAIH